MIRRMRFGLEIARRVQVLWCGWRWWPLVRVWFWPGPLSLWHEQGRPRFFTGYLVGPLDIRVWCERIPDV